MPEDKDDIEKVEGVVKHVDTVASNHPTLHKVWEWGKTLVALGVMPILLIYTFKAYNKVQQMDEISTNIVKLEQTIVDHNSTMNATLKQNVWLKNELEIVKEQAAQSELRSLLVQEVISEWITPLLRDMMLSGSGPVSEKPSEAPKQVSGLSGWIKKKAESIAVPEGHVIVPEEKITAKKAEALAEAIQKAKTQEQQVEQTVEQHVFDPKHSERLEQIEQEYKK